jgi:hypothetical protein
MKTKQIYQEWIGLVPGNYQSIQIPMYELVFEKSHQALQNFLKKQEEFLKTLERFEKIFEVAQLLEKEGMETFRFYPGEMQPYYEYDFVYGLPLKINPFYKGPGVFVSNPKYIEEQYDDEGELFRVLSENFLQNPIQNIINDIYNLKQKFENYKKDFVEKWI